MARRSKYATLDALIVVAIYRRRSHRQIFIDGAYVAQELKRHTDNRWNAAYLLLSRRLQVLRSAGKIARAACSNDWIPCA